MASPTATADVKKSNGSSGEYQRALSFSGKIRNRDPSDERFVALSLTERGEEAMQMIGEAFEKKYGQVLASKSAEEFEELIAGMRKFCAFIQEMSKV
jgi:hypothetical protein